MRGSRMLMLRIILLVLLATDEIDSLSCAKEEVNIMCSVPAKFYPSSPTCYFSGSDVDSSSSLDLNSPLPFYGNSYDKFVVSFICVSDTNVYGKRKTLK